MDLQHLNDALAQGRYLEIHLAFVSDPDGTPVIDVTLSENGRELGGMIGAATVEEALDAVNWRVRKKDGKE